MIKKYDIKSSFNDFYQNCKTKKKPGLKIVAFPTGMGKTYGSANNAVQVSESGDLPIFIAPRIAILKDFEETVYENIKTAEVIRIISDTELKQVDYYYKNIKRFKNISDNIENELLNFIKTNNIKLPNNIISLEAHFSQLNERDIKSNKENYQIFKVFRASKNIQDIYRQFDLLKNSLQQEEIRNELNSKLWKIYNGIIDIFEASNLFYIKNYNSGIYIDQNEIYKIWGFKSFDKQIVKDFFGLTFALCDIKNKQKNDKYIFTITSKKSLKYIGRTFEFKQGKLTKINGTDSNKLFFNKYINTFCKTNNLNPIYYIDEADEFYNEIVEDRTKTIHLNNFLFKIKTFFDYSNISSLLSFIDKIQKSATISMFSNDFKDLVFNYNNAFTADKIEDLISFFESNKISFNPNQLLNDKFLNKLTEKINSNYEISILFKNIINKGNVLFLFLCFLDSLGIDDKIEQLKSNEKVKSTLLLGDLYKSLKNSKDFLKSWHLDKNPAFTLTSKTFFEELQNVHILLISSNLGETIIKNEDFIELAENNKFMFGNDSLSLVEEQIKYLDNLVSVESFSDNALLEIKDIKNSGALTLSYIFSFLTKVLIRTVQEISVPNEDYEEDKTLDKEMSCHTYLKKMKTAFSSLKKIDDSQFKIKDEDLLFNEEYIFNQDKNVINLFSTNYDKNIKFGKPNISSYIQMSNIHIKESPEKEILNYFSTVEHNEVKDFSSNSIVFLMSATTTINSYYGNFDYEYLNKQLELHNVPYDTTYLNIQDIDLVNDFKKPYVNKNITEISCFDYGIYENRQFDVYDNFSHAIKNSTNKSIEILNGEYNKYKLYEFQSFVYSMENLISNPNINSLFFISQTTSHIISFINFYFSDLLNKSSKLISKLGKNGNDYENIFVINKEIFNTDYPKYNLDKDLIIIFYDSKFENKQQATLNSIDNLDTLEEDVSNADLDYLDSTYNGLKKKIFNEDKYKILLCSSFGSISKGFNFVTNQNKKEKDFDAITIGMDPFYDNLSQDKDESLVYQRIVAMKDFNYVNGHAANLNELMDYFYLNKNNLLNKEHLASIARVIIQALGRIERRRHNNHNKTQYLFINNETHKKMEKFYHFYEYDRYIKSTETNTEDNFSSNLSVNNQYLFDSIKKTIGKNVYINDYQNYTSEQISKNQILNEFVNFLLFKVRTNDKIKSEFKYIWEYLKSSTIFHNLSEYIKNLDELVEPKLYELKKYVLKPEFPHLFNLLKNKKYKLSEIFFVTFPINTKIGLSVEKCVEAKPYDIIVDYFNANKSDYDFFKIIFNAEKEDFSTESLKYIKWIEADSSTDEIFRKKYTIGDTLYIPQRKIAIEFIKTAISEEIFKNVLESYKFKIQPDIDSNSYELFDFFIKHNDKLNYTAIDVKFWSIATQATNSKNIEEKVHKKTYVTDLSSVKNILCVNLFGNNKNSNLKNNIYYKNFFIKNQVRSSPNYGKYILNHKLINFLKEEIEK